MQDSTSKEKVLKKIRAALINSMPAPFPPQDMETIVMHPLEDEENLDVSFAMAFKEVKGQFVFASDSNELLNAITDLIIQKDYKSVFCTIPNVKNYLKKKKIDVIEDESQMHQCSLVISDCECLIARYGSIVLSSRQTLSRKGIHGPESNIIIAKRSQIVKDIKDVFSFLKEKYENALPSMFSIVTGPSRTADIEKTLVMGAHGQKELYLFLIG